MKRLKPILLALAPLLVIALLVRAFRPSPITVETARVERGPFVQTIDEDGKARVRNRFVITAPLAGLLQRIALRAGDQVQEGMSVAAIIPTVPPLLDVRVRRELQSRVGAAEAAVARARANTQRAKASLRLAEAENARQQMLLKAHAATTRDAERAQAGLEAAAEDVRAAASEEEASRHQLDAARALVTTSAEGSEGTPWPIRSPVSGSVLRVVRESAGYVPPGDPLIEIGNPEDMEIVVDVLSSDAVQISPGADVTIRQWGGDQPLKGRVRRVEPSATTRLSALGVEEQRVNVLVDITSPREEWVRLGDGFRVETSIVVFRSDDAVKVPASALFREGEGWAVYVVTDGRAHRKTIGTHRRNASEAVVDEGLAPGETVINYPVDAVHERTRVKQASPTSNTQARSSPETQPSPALRPRQAMFQERALRPVV